MAGPQTDTTGKIVPRNGGGKSDLATLVERLKPGIAQALPKHVTPDRMARIVLTALRTNAKLAQCTPASFLGCVMIASQLGLEPNTPLGHLYLIPRGGQCTALIGYQGMIELARRSGQVTSIYAYVVREGDAFRYALGLHPTLEHVPSGDDGRDTKKMTHAYAVAHLRDADPVFVVLSRGDVMARKKRSQASNNGPWVTDEEAMWRKSAVRALYTWVPKSAEMASAIGVEDADEQGRHVIATLDDSATKALAEAGVYIDPASIDAESEVAGALPESRVETDEPGPLG